jgi:hypothetical protein
MDEQEYEEELRRRQRRRSGRGRAWIIVILLLIGAAMLIRGRQPERQTPGAGERASGRCTILIAGTDKEGYRTDTIMLLSLDASKRSVSLLSIPRCKQSSKMHTFSPANAHFFTASF